MSPATVHEARALAYLARQDAGPPPADREDRADWREERRAALDAYRTRRAIAVGSSRLDALRRAVEAGRDTGPSRDLAEALADLDHSGMFHWLTTPYGVVWIDNER